MIHNCVFSRFGLMVATLMLGVMAADAGLVGGRFGIGLTYVNGIMEVRDEIVDDIESNGSWYIDDDFVIPVGLSLQGGYQWESGVNLLVDLGPAVVVLVDAGEEFVMYDIPAGLTLGYTFNVRGKVAPYVRGGIRHHFGGGDYYDSSTPGPFGAAGLYLFGTSAVQLQLEVGYDGSEMTLQREISGGTVDVTPGGFMASIRATF